MSKLKLPVTHLPSSNQIIWNLALNSLPVLTVIFLNWDVLRVLYLFWSETVLITLLPIVLMIAQAIFSAETGFGKVMRFLFSPVIFFLIPGFGQYLGLLVIFAGGIYFSVYGIEADLVNNPPSEVIGQIFEVIWPAILVYGVFYLMPLVHSLVNKRFEVVLKEYTEKMGVRMVATAAIYPVLFIFAAFQMSLWLLILVFLAKAVVEIFDQEIILRIHRKKMKG